MVTHLFRAVRLPPMQVLEEAGDREDIGPGIHEDEDDDMRTMEDRREERRGWSRTSSERNACRRCRYLRKRVIGRTLDPVYMRMKTMT